MELGELAKWNLVFVDELDSLETALKKMDEANIHHIFVKDSSGPKSVVSQSDIVSYILQSSDKQKVLGSPIKLIPSSKLKVFDQDVELGEAINQMKALATDCIVIKSSDDTYGIITLTDIVRVLEQIIVNKDEDSTISQAELTLASPLTQRLLKLLSDLGI